MALIPPISPINKKINDVKNKAKRAIEDIVGNRVPKDKLPQLENIIQPDNRIPLLRGQNNAGKRTANFDLNQFQHSASGTFARPNRFEAIITAPSTLQTDAVQAAPLNQIQTQRAASTLDASRFVSLRLAQVQMPGRNIRTVTNDNIYGPTHEVAQGLTFAEELTCVFYLSDDHAEKQFFVDWQDTIVDEKTYNVSYYNEYVTSMLVHQLDRNDVITATVEIRDIFPKTISVLDYGQATNNDILRLTVGFAFREWAPYLKDVGKPYEQYREEITTGFNPAVQRGGVALPAGIARDAQRIISLKKFFGGILKNKKVRNIFGKLGKF